MGEGYVKLFRKITEWEWYRNIPVRILFEHCLVKANYAESKFQGTIVPIGSFITSYDRLSAETGLSVQQVRTAINKLKSTDEITTKSTNEYTLVYVQKWANYQGENGDINTPNDKQPNKRITNEQQTNNKRITTSEELKNGRNKEKEKTPLQGVEKKARPRFIKPLFEEVKAYCEEMSFKMDPHRFYDYEESKGWKVGSEPMKDWKATMRNWERRDLEEKKKPSNGKPEVKIDWLDDYIKKTQTEEKRA